MEQISYLSGCLTKGKIIRWPNYTMPLKLYIAPFRWYKAKDDSYSYMQMVKDSLDIWQNASNGQVSFKLVPTLFESQVNIDWKRVERSSLGHCYFNFDNMGRLFSAEVNIGLSDGVIHSQYQDKNEVLHTIIHEIGHAVGLQHSPYKNDIMYVPHQYGVTSISNRDKTTLKWLYKFPYGLSASEILAEHKLGADYDIDALIYSLENEGKQIHTAGKKYEQLPANPEILDEEQQILAKINKHNLSLQNIIVSPHLQDFFKNIKFKKDK